MWQRNGDIAMDDQIRERAFEIWEQEGRPDGRHEQHWQMASDELRQRGSSEGPTTPSGGTVPGNSPATGVDAIGGGGSGRVARSANAKRKRA